MARARETRRDAPRCTGCGVADPSAFYPSRADRCKGCIRAGLTNPAAHREANRRYYDRHREELMEQERMEQRLRAEARDRGPTVPPPEWVDHFKSREEAAAYLAAMIDGEGSVGHYRNPCVSRTLRITNTDRELIDACSEACLLLGIAHIVDNGKALPSGKTSWELAVHRVDDIRRVAELPIRSYRKRAKLAEALASARPNYRPSRQVLEQLYVFDGKTAVEIARLLGAAPRSVLSWLRAEGIPVRSRSEATLMGHRTRAVRRAAQKAAS